MSESLAASIKLSLNSLLSGDSDLEARDSNLAYSKTNIFENGTGLDQANQIWSDTRTIAASGADDLDLAGVLTSSLGTTLTFTKIKAIIVRAAVGNTNNVVVGGDGTAPLLNFIGSATATIIVRPGGLLALIAPDATAYAVTATTGDILQIANSSSGTSVTYDIIIVGVV